MIVKLIPYRSFKEKIAITKRYDKRAKMQVVDNKYIYMEINNENINENFNIDRVDIATNNHK